MVNQSSNLDLLFHALADPTRRDILLILRDGPKRVTALAKPHKMSLPAVSKHLKVLQSARLIRRHQKGREHILQLNHEALEPAALWLKSSSGVSNTASSFEPLDSILL